MTFAQIDYIYSDQLNTPRLITDTANTPVWRNDQADPFNASAPYDDPGNTGQHFVFNLRFPGQYYDQETGLAYNYFRDYDATTGRYVEADPIGVLKRSVDPLFSAYNKPLNDNDLARGINHLYTYVRGNPVSRTDPSGLAPGDQKFGLPDPFWHWFHRSGNMECEKGANGQVPKSVAQDYYKIWQGLGSPKPGQN